MSAAVAPVLVLGWGNRSRGDDALGPLCVQALQDALQPGRDVNGADVKAQLKAHTDEAIAAQVFGVPSMVVDGRVFWGLDALPMLADYLRGGAWFQGPDWDAVTHIPAGIQRQRP